MSSYKLRVANLLLNLFTFRERGREGERERERERNIDVREKHQSVISDVCPNLESNTT